MLLMVSVALPLLVSVTVCGVLVVPICWLGKVTMVGEKLTLAPIAVPLRATLWGDPAALSAITIAPLRAPRDVGVKVTERVQLPAAETLVAQSSVSAKSPVVVIEEIESDALPMLRSRSVCGWLATPTA